MSETLRGVTIHPSISGSYLGPRRIFSTRVEFFRRGSCSCPNPFTKPYYKQLTGPTVEKIRRWGLLISSTPFFSIPPFKGSRALHMSGMAFAQEKDQALK